MSHTHSAIKEIGTSLWLDDLSRSRFDGSLDTLISTYSVSGVTTNPAIFSAAISGSPLYIEDIKRLSAKGASTDQILTALTTDDVQRACDLFERVYEESLGVDGRVSIEVDPTLARDTEATIAQALELAELINRKNLLVKIPATREGLPAIAELIARGISINVTLIFSLERYRDVIAAYMAGLEERIAKNLAINEIHSVASFFISRVDTAIDPLLDQLVNHREIGAESAGKLRGKIAIANAWLAYRSFEESLTEQRWSRLEKSGAQLQRPLWASTGVKDPLYSPTLYVENLLAPHTVNTMPEKTLLSCTDIKKTEIFNSEENYESAETALAELATLGISLNQITEQLEIEGVKKFVDPWLELKSNIEKARS